MSASLNQAVYVAKLCELAALGRSRHLDIGAGTGENVRLSMELGLKPIALEYDVDYARRISSPTVRSSGVRLPFGEDTFDVVTLMHVLEHVPDYMGVLREIRRILGAGGCLIIEVPNRYSLQEFLNLVYARFFLRGARRHLGHCNFFTHGRLQRCLLQTGFEVVDHRVGGGPFHGTIRPTIDLVLRLFFKVLLHRGKHDAQDNEQIARIHRRLSPVYDLLLRADRCIERATLRFVEVVGFVAQMH